MKSGLFSALYRLLGQYLAHLRDTKYLSEFGLGGPGYYLGLIVHHNLPSATSGLVLPTANNVSYCTRTNSRNRSPTIQKRMLQWHNYNNYDSLIARYCQAITAVIKILDG